MGVTAVVALEVPEVADQGFLFFVFWEDTAIPIPSTATYQQYPLNVLEKSACAILYPSSIVRRF